MQRVAETPDQYLADQPSPLREQLTELDRVISGTMSGLERVLWRGVFWGGTEQAIIGYGDYRTTNSRGKEVEWFLVGLAVQKNYLSIYITADEDGQHLSKKYGSTLGKVKVGASSISFAAVEDIDVEALTALLTKARTLNPDVR
jgi:hypothetical protein